jgi:hypothetical protein
MEDAFMNQQGPSSPSFPVPWLPSLLLVFLPFAAYLGIWGVLTGLEICAWNRPDQIDAMQMGPGEKSVSSLHANPTSKWPK